MHPLSDQFDVQNISCSLARLTARLKLLRRACFELDVCVLWRISAQISIHVLVQTGVELELVDSQPVLEWLANNYKTFGAALEIITDRSQEGAQFVKGFGGIGGQFKLITSNAKTQFVLW